GLCRMPGSWKSSTGKASMCPPIASMANGRTLGADEITWHYAPRLRSGRWSGLMRNAGRAILVVVAAVVPWTVEAEPYVTARGAVIVDADSGAVIWEQNADEELPPASTTKVMTAILALQSHQLDDHFVVTDYAASTPPMKIGFRPGQTVALRDLLYAVLLKSANDAAVVVAEGVAGS